MLRILFIVHRVVYGAFFFALGVTAYPADSLLIRSSDLYSPQPLMSPAIPDKLINRTFQIPTELIARRLNLAKFDTLENLLQLEHALRRELDAHHVNIPPPSTNLAEKEVRIGPPSTLSVRATRRDLAKIDLLLAEWMRTVHFQIEIFTAETSLADATDLLSHESLKLGPYALAPVPHEFISPSFISTAVNRIPSGRQLNTPLAAGYITQSEKQRLQKNFSQKTASSTNEEHSPYVGERLALPHTTSDVRLFQATIRPFPNAKNPRATDLTFEFQPTQIISAYRPPQVDLTGLRPSIGTGFTRIRTTEPAERTTHTLPPESSLLVLSASASKTLPPPQENRTITFHIITSRVMFTR